MIASVRESLSGLTFWEIALMLLVIAPLYLAGWLAGVIVRVTLWVVAAIVEGYKAGMGE